MGEKKNKVLTSCASRRYVAVGFLKENIIAPDLIIATATFNKHTCASATKSTPLLQYSKFSIRRHNPDCHGQDLRPPPILASCKQNTQPKTIIHKINLSRTNQLPPRKKRRPTLEIKTPKCVFSSPNEEF